MEVAISLGVLVELLVLAGVGFGGYLLIKKIYRKLYPKSKISLVD